MPSDQDNRSPAVQDHYPEDFAYCYGCGRLNGQGLGIRSHAEGDQIVARFMPRPQDLALPGFVYGGLLASLIDCHAMAAAAATVERQAGRAIGDAPSPRFVTASLHVQYLKPTPHGHELELRARATEVGERKVTVTVDVHCHGQVTVRGTVVAARMPPTMVAT